MQDDEPLRRPAPGSESDPLADDLVLVEPELDARPSGQDLAVFGQRPSGMGPGDRAVVVVKISRPFSQASSAASVRRKALCHDARTLLDALHYRIDLTPGQTSTRPPPAAKISPAHQRLARPDAFRQHLATATPPPDARSASTPQPTADDRDGARQPRKWRG